MATGPRANEIRNTPAGNIAATNVQDALNELDAEKLALSGGTMTGNLAMGGNKVTGMPVATSNGEALVFEQLPSTGNVVRTVTANHTLDSTDLSNIQTGKPYTLYVNSATAVDVTIPTNATVAIPANAMIAIVQVGAGQITILGPSVTLRSPNSANKSYVQYSTLFITQDNTVNTWYISGDITV